MPDIHLSADEVLDIFRVWEDDFRETPEEFIGEAVSILKYTGEEIAHLNAETFLRIYEERHGG